MRFGSADTPFTAIAAAITWYHVTYTLHGYLGAKVNLRQIGAKVKQQRTQLGLLQEQVARLAGLSRATVNRLENGTLNDIGYAKLSIILDVLGINMQANEAASLKSGLAVAAKSASTSYRITLTPEALSELLRTGEVPAQFQPHVMAFLEEAPLPILVKAVSEAASNDVPTSKIIKNLQHLAKEWQICREVWQH